MRGGVRWGESWIKYHRRFFFVVNSLFCWNANGLEKLCRRVAALLRSIRWLYELDRSVTMHLLSELVVFLLQIECGRFSSRSLTGRMSREQAARESVSEFWKVATSSISGI